MKILHWLHWLVYTNPVPLLVKLLALIGVALIFRGKTKELR